MILGLSVIAYILFVIIPKNNAEVQIIDSETLKLLSEREDYERAVSQYFQEKGYAEKSPQCWGRNSENQLVLTFRIGWNNYCFTYTENGWTVCH